MMTPEQYRASLRDGRRIYLDGQPVPDVSAHLRLCTAVDAVAKGYSRYYREGTRNPVMSGPRTAEELRARTDALKRADSTMNTTFSSLMALLSVAAEVQSSHPRQSARMLASYEDALDRDVRITECITDAKGDRSLPPAKQEDPDAYLRIVGRTPDGVVIRGAKLHITGAPIAHELMVMPTKRMKPGEEDYAVVCLVPVNAPGVTIICTTYAPTGEDTRSFPVSGKQSMPDGLVVFDDVFVPQERVLMDGELEQSASFAHSLGLWERVGGAAKLAEEADLLVGLAQLVAEANGTNRIAHIKDKIASMVVYSTMIRGMVEAALANADTSALGFMYPSDLYTNAAKYYGAAGYHEAVRNLHDIAGGSAATRPSIADLDHPDIGDYVRKYLQGAAIVSGEERLRIFHAIHDVSAGEFGGWRMITNIQSGGGLFAQRLVTRKHYDMGHALTLAREAAGIA